MAHGRFQALRSFLAAGIVATLSLAASQASAAPIISSLHATGDSDQTAGGQDSNWQVVAWPVSAGSFTPYQAWVFSGAGTQFNIPGPWLNGPSNPLTWGGRWIGLKQNDASSLLPVVTTPSSYTTIYATTFNASEAGTADFSFLAAADNTITLFVGGSIDFTSPDNPTITNGALIDSISGFGKLKWLEGSAAVVSGANTLYAVVEDHNTSGLYYATGLMIVPEPSSIVSAGLGIACLALVALRRQVKSRG